MGERNEHRVGADPAGRRVGGADDRCRTGDDVIPLAVLTIATAVALVLYGVWVWTILAG